MENNHTNTEHNNEKVHHRVTKKLRGHAGTLEMKLVPVFEGVPHLPNSWINFITKIAPWFSLIFGILGLFVLVGAGALMTLLSPFVLIGQGFVGLISFIHIIIGIISSILGIIAFKPLKDMKKDGWDYSFYSFILTAISSILGILMMSFGVLDIVWVLLGAYVLFEIRNKYTN